MKIRVTGETGNVGLETLKLLSARASEKLHIVAAVLNPNDAARILPSSVSVVKFDFGDRDSVKTALLDVTTLFLLRPPQLSDVKTFLFPTLMRQSGKSCRTLFFCRCRARSSTSSRRIVRSSSI